MASEHKQFHIFFLPYMSPGHMIPNLDMAILFATRGIQSTIITTPLNIPFFTEAIEAHTQVLGIKIKLLTMEFPCQEAGLPVGCESADCVPSPQLVPNFFKATALLEPQFETLMEEFQPDCLVADYFLPWATSVATKLGVPCLCFHGSSYFFQCAFSNLLRYETHRKVSSDSYPFTVPDLPHEIKFTRMELSPYERGDCQNWLTQLVDEMREAQIKCHGLIMNSFYELEPAYADYYEKSLGFKHWHIGPLFLHFRRRENGADLRGKKSSIDVNACLRWLDKKEDNSVMYICFGSMSNMGDAQLDEIARALESLPQNFILVVRNSKGWIPDGFEGQVEGRGLIIRGWAPQRLILEHRAIGGFMSHCGWNSVLEGVAAGVPMVTWPIEAEQFYNEKLLTEILRIGVSVRKKRLDDTDDKNEIVIGKAEIVKAIIKMGMGEKEAKDMRKRARELKEMATRAIQEGGSSYSDLTALILQLRAYKK